jgi:hypothetical protein
VFFILLPRKQTTCSIWIISNCKPWEILYKLQSLCYIYHFIVVQNMFPDGWSIGPCHKVLHISKEKPKKKLVFSKFFEKYKVKKKNGDQHFEVSICWIFTSGYQVVFNRVCIQSNIWNTKKKTDHQHSWKCTVNLFLLTYGFDLRRSSSEHHLWEMSEILEAIDLMSYV